MKKFKVTIALKSALRNFLLSLPLIIFFLLLSTEAMAQAKWQANFRAGANFPTTKLGGADLNNGFGFDAGIAYRILPHLFVNTGWGWNRFSANQSFAGADMDFEETGYGAGLQFIHPIEKSKLKYVLGAGAIYKHIEVENNKGEIIANTGHGWGWQADAGLLIPLGKRFHLHPGIRYQSLSREFNIGTTKTPADLNYLSAGVVVSFSF